MNPSLQLRKAIRLFLVTLVCFTVLPSARAVVPPPDGGYPGNNTAEGEDALFSLTSGFGNTAMGFNALFSNTSGSVNTATGIFALQNNTDGSDNTAVGDFVLQSNTIGYSNTATGGAALQNNTDGFGNTANGSVALQSNTDGFLNTATGYSALNHNTIGSTNVAAGVDALFSNISGSVNTANGGAALASNTTGSANVADGFGALADNTTGDNNIALGTSAGINLTTGNNNIDIGNAGLAGEGKTIRIGTQGTQTKTFIAGISNAAIGGMEVRVNQNGRLGIEPSSKRFKDEIKPMDRASEAILALKPVTFRYKKEMDADRTLQFGLVAEDVEKVNPNLVVKDAEAKVYTVRYEAVNAMLLNEFLKEHRTVQELKKRVAALTAGLQKGSAQLEMSKPARQTVLSNQ